MMKKYRGLVPVALVVLMAASLYTMISDAAAQQNEVEELLIKAEGCIQQGLYDKAVTYYNGVIAIENKSDHYIAVADMYYDAAQYDLARKWCEAAISIFPKDAAAYERMLRVCLKQEAYSEAYSILDEFDGRKLVSEAVERYREEMKHLYYITSVSYDEIGQFSSGYVGVCNKGLWGLASVKGNNVIRPVFDRIGYYANGVVSVRDKEGIWYLMNTEGEYLYNISCLEEGTVTDAGMYSYEYIPVCVDGVYGFYDLEGELKFGGYDYAGSFSGGVAAVKNEGVWRLVNTKGVPVTEETYLDIILDDRGICCQKGRIFAGISQDEYILLNASGERVGSETFEGARLFGGEYAAVMQHGLWGYIGLSGEFFIEPKYEDAKSFYEGVAAVCKDGLWGYMDPEENVIIKQQYLECLNFSSAGTAFAKKDNKWEVIRFYYNNH